jgi:hypothetical protein
MKEKLLLSLLILAFFSVSAQDFKKQSAITLAVGPSIPVGTFADKNLYDEKAGLAAVGGFANISYSNQFSKFFGVLATLGGRINGVDKNALGSYSLPTGSGATLGIEASTWQFFSVMGGLFQTVPITSNEKLTFEIKEMIGVQFSSSPEITTTGFIPGVGSLNSTEERQSVSSLAYALGLGFKYKLGGNLGLKLFGDYQGASPKFTFIGSGPADEPIEQKLKQNTSAINVGLGLSFGF